MGRCCVGSSALRSKVQRRLHGGEVGTAQESGSARERDSERASLKNYFKKF